MYLITIVLLMAVFPVLSVLTETLLLHGHINPVFLIGKWFVFWAVGIRLLTAGVRQVLDPTFTAETIFGIKDPSAHKLVSEIGFGNLAIGILATLTLLIPSWVTPAAFVGCIFYLLAGAKHVLNQNRSRHETIAMVSDLAIAILLAAYLGAIYVTLLSMLP